MGGGNWAPEVDALKNCDYVLPPVAAFVPFVKEYTSIGGKGRFFGADPHAALFSLVSDAQLWDEIDGMLFVKESEFWALVQFETSVLEKSNECIS